MLKPWIPHCTKLRSEEIFHFCKSVLQTMFPLTVLIRLVSLSRWNAVFFFFFCTTHTLPFLLSPHLLHAFNSNKKAGSTPLHWAARGGHLDCVEALLAQPKIQVNVQNKLGDTPLHLAAYRGHPETISLLLEKGEILAFFDIVKRCEIILYAHAKCIVWMLGLLFDVFVRPRCFIGSPIY
jgi:hypothetical protein